MVQFQAFDPKVEVSGSAVQAIVTAMGSRSLPVLAKYGLAEIDPDEWYPQQRWLDAFAEIAQGDFSTVLDLVSIGMRISDVARWPTDIETIEDALFSVDRAYQMAHRNGVIGSYRVRIVSEYEAKLICENPYPCHFDYGIIYGTARRFLPSDKGLAVVHDDHGRCRRKGDDFCTYYVSWGR
jgi:hypothetical protein